MTKVIDLDFLFIRFDLSVAIEEKSEDGVSVIDFLWLFIGFSEFSSKI
jgi:hypothetical protein